MLGVPLWRDRRWAANYANIDAMFSFVPINQRVIVSSLTMGLFIGCGGMVSGHLTGEGTGGQTFAVNGAGGEPARTRAPWPPAIAVPVVLLAPCQAKFTSAVSLLVVVALVGSDSMGATP